MEQLISKEINGLTIKHPMACQAKLVNAVAVDKNDIKWIGTPNGLAKLDGSNWTVYNIFNSPLPANSINTIEIDKYGSVWAGTYRGLAKFDGSNWLVYAKENSGLINNIIGS